MSTDLFDESELDTDDSDFDWEEFLPDPEDGAVGIDDGASATADDGELDVDDSEFEWEANLQSDDPLSAEEAGVRTARIEAAFARLEHAATGDPNPAAHRTLHSEEFPSGVGGAHEDGEPELLLVPDAQLPAREESRTELDPDAGIEPEPELVLLDEAAETEWFPQGSAGLADESLFVHQLPDPGPEVTAAPVFEPDPDVGPTPIYEPAGIDESEAVDKSPDAPVETTAYEPVDIGKDPTDYPTSAYPTSARLRRASEPHSRVYTATVVLACSLLVLVSAVLIIRSVDRSAPAHSELFQAARIKAATDEANLATTTALAGMSSLTYLASSADIAQVANPYAESLQLYGSFLSGAQVPAQARSATAHVLAEARSDASFLGTIQGLGPGQLGSYIHSFYTNAAQLQSSLIALETQLPSTSSS